MNDLDLCLVMSTIVLHLMVPLETEAWFQRTTNKKWPMETQIVTRLLTSHDYERSSRKTEQSVYSEYRFELSRVISR